MFSLLKKAQTSGLRAGIAISADAAALVRVRRRNGARPLLEFCEEQSVGNDDADLGQLVHRAELARAKLSAALGNDAYQLVQVEAPDVLPAELRAAIRWRLRDVINFHIDDAVVDVFEIPDQSRRTQSKMMFAVAARSGAVQQLVNSLSKHARGFDVIDIPELCLRNLSALLPQDQKGVALLALGEGFAQLVLTRQGVVYLTRRIDFARRYELSANETEQAPAIDAPSLALELQRSLDYYESHFDQPPIGDLIIAPMGARASALAAALADESSLRIGVFNTEEVLELAPGVSGEFNWLRLVALGAALRTDSIEL